MFIRNLSLTNFRAINRLELELPTQLTLLHGENAQGKTSIIEAIHFCSIMTSPIASHDRELVNFLCLKDQQPFSRLVAGIEKKGKLHRLEIRLIINQTQNGNNRLTKEVLLDGVKRKLFNMVGFFNSVLFLPQMTRIIEDGPDERRKYLDQTLSQAYPGYMQAISEYQQAIIRRNALLKQLFETNADEDQLLYWDQLISEKGAFIIHTRKKAVSELGNYLSQQHLTLTDAREVIQLNYLPSFYPHSGNKHKDLLDGMEINSTEYSLEEIQSQFFEALQKNHKEEIRRGITTIGPHRDELEFIANEIDLHVYGSRGQVRSAILSLKLAETLWLHEKTGELPVILLDETLAELDSHRREKLLSVITDGWQAVFTTADINLFTGDFIKRCAVWAVSEGQVKHQP